jgi:ferredoxin
MRLTAAPVFIQKSYSRRHALVECFRGRTANLIEPVTAAVDEARCSGCWTCGAVCPYQAISYPPEGREASVNSLLCHGCGTCVAACPSGAIRGNHFTSEQIQGKSRRCLQDTDTSGSTGRSRLLRAENCAVPVQLVLLRRRGQSRCGAAELSPEYTDDPGDVQRARDAQFVLQA